MSVEIEKKYRLAAAQRAKIIKRLPKIGAKLEGREFEENTLYDGPGIDISRSVLRLRRVGKRGILTYKERFPSATAIKHQREEETEVSDPATTDAILGVLGFRPSVVYEKRRTTWSLGKVEIVIDDLPFGLFMEIEGPAKEITKTEKLLGAKDLPAEHTTYPELAQQHGKKRKGRIEARFPKRKR
ncbi:MAG TPA: class IV adenylate cyclase [Pyrinomonadaceae bacterium]|nr:class IV adenylate cyclase [Pyrinomonadaceae bacterium]